MVISILRPAWRPGGANSMFQEEKSRMMESVLTFKCIPRKDMLKLAQRKHTGTYTFVTRVQGVLYKTKAPFLSGRYCPCLFHSLKAMLDLLIHAASSPQSLHLSVSVSGLSPEPWKFVWYYRVAQECWRFNTLRSTPSTYEKWESADKTQAS